MAIGAEFDPATGCVKLVARAEPVGVGLLLRDERWERASASSCWTRPLMPCWRKATRFSSNLRFDEIDNLCYTTNNDASACPRRPRLEGKQVFSGKVVRQGPGAQDQSAGANVPAFVLEYLLGKYCASADEVTIQMGIQVVKDILANNYIRPDEAIKAQSRVKEEGRYSFIDKVKVRLVDSDYWAYANNFGHSFIHVPTHYVRDYERLLTGGIWAQVEMRFEYDEETRGKYPFWIDRLTPIQLATFDLADIAPTAPVQSAEWVDFLVRSMGYEPTELDRRTKLLFLLRLIPLCEQNFNLVELGPRGTGKSYVIQEFSPYAALLTGPTTVANLFGHMSGRQKGMVAIWDVVGFDEVADLQKMPKEVITTMKTYCESGTFQRGQEERPGLRQHRHVRQHQPTGRGHGADRPSLCAAARRDPQRHGLHRLSRGCHRPAQQPPGMRVWVWPSSSAVSQPCAAPSVQPAVVDPRRHERTGQHQALAFARRSHCRWPWTTVPGGRWCR